jgi:hypothetical protein
MLALLGALLVHQYTHPAEAKLEQRSTSILRKHVLRQYF